jgi:predicted 3-demethylubiquinone-9 3-methyltransferase (glyoxalase superfamily)
MQKITPFRWFDGNAEEAMNFYVSIFKNSKIFSIHHGGKNGGVMGGTFQLEGQEFHALNGGPQFKFTPAISFYVDCVTQQEIDELWEKLSAGGEKSLCGWLKDKYGLSWQINPSILDKLMGDSGSGNSKKVWEAMLQLTKMDIKTLQQAYDQK